jgi:hypothetical protein
VDKGPLFQSMLEPIRALISGRIVIPMTTYLYTSRTALPQEPSPDLQLDREEGPVPR